MNIFTIFKSRKTAQNISRLYAKIIAQARLPQFYEALGISDTFNGRFDLIALHAFIVMRRLKTDGLIGQKISQELFDFMFADIDTNLREMGVGDLSVSRKIKQLVSAYYGRIKAYENVLENNSELALVLKRNLFADQLATQKQIS